MMFVKDKQLEKIALFIPGFAGGGAENVFVILANFWASQGISVDYLVLDDKGPMKARLSGDISIRLISGGNFKVLRRCRIAKAIAQYCEEEKPNLLLSTLTYCNLCATLAKRLWGIGSTRLIVREANALENIRKAGKLNSLLTIWAMRQLYPHADVVSANSEYTLEQLMVECGVPKQMCRLVRNPVPETRPDAFSDQDDGIPLVLGCGRLIPQKDFETLIRAVARVREETDCRLVILGEGPERVRLDQVSQAVGLPADRFDLVGFVPSPKPYFNKASVFVLASKWEGLPNVVLEALSVGVPVVATDCSGGTREIFAGAEDAHLVAIGDYEAMASKALNFIRKRPQKKLIQSLVYPKFSVADIAQNYTEV